jgi:hypothetical protein
MILNAAFGKVGMNTANYNKSITCDAKTALLKHSNPHFMSSTAITEDLYTVQLSQQSYSVKTPLQCAVWTLDNAKYWYIKLVYDFMVHAFDMSKIHFAEGDTDSSYWAISGKFFPPYEIPTDACPFKQAVMRVINIQRKIKKFKQGFTNVIKNQKFYDENIGKWLPDPKKMDKRGNFPVEDEKKLLGATVEKEGLQMVAVAPKCYFISDTLDEKTERWLDSKGTKTVMKVKGVSLGRNKISPKDYKDVIEKGKIIKGENCGFHMKRLFTNEDGAMTTKKVIGLSGGIDYMTKLETEKNAITPTHNKMVCLPNFSCAPFIEGLTKEDYICK